MHVSNGLTRVPLMNTNEQGDQQANAERTFIAASKALGRWLVRTACFAVVLSLGYYGLVSLRRAEPPAPPEVELTPEQQIAAVKDEMVQRAERLLEDFPDSVDPMVLMGDVVVSQGDFPQAMIWWEKARTQDPNRLDVYEKLASFAYDTDAFEESVAWGRKALAIDANVPGIHHQIARSLAPLGRDEEVIAEAEAELVLSPESWRSYFLLGQAHWRLRDYDKARAAYLKVIELRPDHTKAHYGLFNVCRRMKRLDEAKRYMDRFKALDERNKVQTQRYDEVMTDLNRFAMNLTTLCVQAHRLYRDAGDMEQAEALLQRAIALYPRNIAHLEMLVELYRTDRRIPEALSVCERIEAIDPNNVPCHLNKGNLSMRLERFDDAQRAFQQAMARAPEHWAGYQGLARLYLWSGRNVPETPALAERALALNPSASNHFVLAWACKETGDLERAVSALERALELDPTNAKYRAVYENVLKERTVN